MSMRENVIAAGKLPGWSMLELLPECWWVVPLRGDDASDLGAMLLLGGPLAGDPEVMVRIEYALPPAGGRDLTEPFARWLAEIVASELCGAVQRIDLSDKEVAELTSQLHRLRVMVRAGR
jgi:hypothetical protein